MPTKIESYLDELWERKGTDLLLTAGAPPLVRVDGELTPIEGATTLGPTDTESLHHALRSAFREDPDVLLVGEMRDPESIETTLTIAETGHLVFATLHTNDAAQAIDRVVDVFPGTRQDQIRVQLSSSLSGIISQRLMPRIGGGMVAAYEVLVATPAVRNLIKEGKSPQIRNVISTSQKDGMQTMEAALSELVASEVVTYDEAVSRSLHPREVKKPPAPEEHEPAGRRSRRGRRG